MVLSQNKNELIIRYFLVRLLKMKCLIVFLCLMVTSLFTFAQSKLEWDDFVSTIYDEMGEDEQTMESLISELEEIHLNPMNLNDVTEEDLQKLPFLTENQIRDIIFYRSKNELFMSLGELMLIKSLDYDTRQRIRLFCDVSDLENYSNKNYSLVDLLKYSRHEIMGRTDIPFYTKDGYRNKPDSLIMKSPNKIYRGNSNYNSLRYAMSSRNQLYAGFQFEKDAGEKPFDYLAFYIQYKKNRGLLRNLILGDYRVAFAQGLVINSNMNFGKLSVLGNQNYTNRGFTKHSSISELNHFRGAAITTKFFNKIDLNLFFSYMNLDGTMRSDSLGISSLVNSGLHRTLLERSKKGNISELACGGNVQLLLPGWQLGLTAMHSHLSIPLLPTSNSPSTIYKRYYPKGSDFTNYSINYGFVKEKIRMVGETASTIDGGIATINNLQYNIGNLTNISLIQRYYSKDYTSLHANSFGENTSVQNENGICLALTTAPLQKVKLMMYADYVYFPFLRYQVSESSYAFDIYGRINYDFSTKSSWQFNYRLKSKQKDCKLAEGKGEELDKTKLYFFTNQSIRLQNTFDMSSHFSLKSTTSLNIIFNPNSGNSYGYGFGEILRWKDISNRKVELALAYFNTDNYDARIYLYEPTLLYSLGMTNYAYHGIRASLHMSLPLFKQLTFSCKLATTKYFNRKTIGSALELIDNSHKEDLQLQIRYKF